MKEFNEMVNKESSEAPWSKSKYHNNVDNDKFSNKFNQADIEFDNESNDSQED